MERFAVIDLGTNTFHILIVEKSGNDKIPFKEIYREKRFVKLAEEGIATIGSIPFQRAITTLIDYRTILDQYEVSTFQACGTAALRTASNGKDLLQAALQQANIPIKIIDGDTEARLIQKGVALTLPVGIHQHYLIMDIGGGSVEFIICNNDEVLWAQSFPIGAAVLYKDFHHSDPITDNEITQLYTHLEQILQPLFAALSIYPTYHLIGASGTFDVLAMNLVGMSSTDLYVDIPVKKFAPLYQDVLFTTHQERYDRSDIPNNRADMIIVALGLIDFIIKKVSIQRLSVSNFAMKEGILTEILTPATSL